ncbi:LLM class F420-dependent oxidoreductase [Nocardioides campestrisoli]|uniref:LLM class F420-dependent oxidoreductase n=1 Tax=Nocardioides campestrisoli TaxID=2736757 RepID=UPI00163D5CC8|nr:LLM class F420-dependent oxidoreductase [Nocardioides campestrisoli]
MTIPLEELPVARLPEVARELEDLGYTDLWTAEGMGADGFTPLAAAAAVTTRVHLGIAIAPAFTRGPALLAQTAATLAAMVPGRFTLGIGASSNVIVEQWNGIPYEKPLSRSRDLLRFLRPALAGERVDQTYDTFAVHGFRLGVVPDPAPRLLLAGLRGKMLELAGAEADGAVLNWLSAEDVGRVAPQVHAGGEGKEIVARILVAPTRDAELARAVARRMITTYLNVPVYRQFHASLGRDELEPMWKLWDEGDRRGALEAVPEAVIDELVVHGSPEECRDHIARFTEHGVTVPVAHLLPVEANALQACRDLAPR